MKKLLSITIIMALLVAILQVPFSVSAASYLDFSYENILIYDSTENWTKTSEGEQLTNLAAEYARTYTRYGAGSGNKGGNIIANDDRKFNHYNENANNNDDCASFVSRAYAFAGVDFTEDWFAWGVDTSSSANTTAYFASAHYIEYMLLYTQSPIKGVAVTNKGTGGWYKTGTYRNDEFKTGDIVLFDFDGDYTGDHCVIVIDDNGTIASSNGDMQLVAKDIGTRWSGSYKLIRPVSVKRIKKYSNSSDEFVSIDMRAGKGIGENNQLAYVFDETKETRYGTTGNRHTPVTIPKLYNVDTGEVYYCTEYEKMHPIFKNYIPVGKTLALKEVQFISLNGYYSEIDTYTAFNSRVRDFATQQNKQYIYLVNDYEAYCATQIAIWMAYGNEFSAITTNEASMNLYAQPSKRVYNAAQILYQQSKKVSFVKNAPMTLEVKEGTGFKQSVVTIDGVKYNTAGPYTVSANLEFSSFAVQTSESNIKSTSSLSIADLANGSNNKTYTKGTSFYLYAPITISKISFNTIAIANQMYNADSEFNLYQSAINGNYQQQLLKAPYNPVRPEGRNKISLEFEGQGSLKIVKTSEDNIIEGVEFRVQGTDGNTYDETFVTDANGEILIENLDLGDYTITETVDDKYISQEIITITIVPGEVTIQNFTNKLLRAPVQIIKTDGTTQKPLPNAEFELRDSNDNVIDTLVTNTEGKATSISIPVGTGYYLIETRAPEGYAISEEKISFDVTKADEDTVIIKSMTNDPRFGKIKITKTGEQLTGYTTSESNFGTVYTPVYEIKKLSNATFQIIAAESITTADGTVRYQKDEVVNTITTGETGIAISKELFLGNYIVKEIEAPAGYAISEETYAVALTADNNIEDIVMSDVTANNTKQKIQILIKKEMENNELYPNPEAYKQVVFGVFTAQDIVIDDNTIILKDSLLELAGVDENGNGIFKADLPFGNYYIKELQTAKGYILDGNSYPFTFSEAAQDITAIELDLTEEYGVFKNTVVRGLLEITKVSAMDGVTIENAKYGVYTTNDELVETLITDKNGKASVTLPYGEYYLKEIEAPLNYLLDEKTYPFTISDENKNKVIKVEMTLKDEPIIGNIIPEYDESGTDEGIDGKEDSWSAKTGDTSNITLYFLLLAISTFALIFLYRKRKTITE